jgi:formamidopyrimidine-DNA glycosylase
VARRIEGTRPTGHHRRVPELPDVDLYVERLGPRILGQPLLRVRLANPFLLRSVEPPLAATFC